MPMQRTHFMTNAETVVFESHQSVLLITKFEIFSRDFLSNLLIHGNKLSHFVLVLILSELSKSKTSFLRFRGSLMTAEETTIFQCIWEALQTNLIFSMNIRRPLQARTTPLLSYTVSESILDNCKATRTG